MNSMTFKKDLIGVQNDLSSNPQLRAYMIQKRK